MQWKSCGHMLHKQEVTDEGFITSVFPLCPINMVKVKLASDAPIQYRESSVLFSLLQSCLHSTLLMSSNVSLKRCEKVKSNNTEVQS